MFRALAAVTLVLSLAPGAAAAGRPFACEARPVGSVVAFGCKNAPAGAGFFVLDAELKRLRFSPVVSEGPLGTFAGFGKTFPAWGTGKVPAIEVRFRALPPEGQRGITRTVTWLLVAGAMVTLVDPSRGDTVTESPCVTLVEMMCTAGGAALCVEIRRELDGKVPSAEDERQCGELLGDPVKLKDILEAVRAAGEESAEGPPSPGAPDPER